MALTPPYSMGYPFTTLSLKKLRDAIVERGIVADISIFNLQKILKDEKLIYQAVRTWKESDDPDFEKKRRIDSLTRKRHNTPGVLSFDEARRLSSSRWVAATGRLAAALIECRTYSRKGTRQLLLAFNYHHGTFFGNLRRRKTAKNILSFFRELRRHYPVEQLMHNNGQPVSTLNSGHSEMGEGEQGLLRTHTNKRFMAQFCRMPYR